LNSAPCFVYGGLAMAEENGKPKNGSEESASSSEEFVPTMTLIRRELANWGPWTDEDEEWFQPAPIAATASVGESVLITCDRDHLRIARDLPVEVLYLQPPV
jgi:hypothetical protein